LHWLTDPLVNEQHGQTLTAGIL